MLAVTPRGFKDVLPQEARWRENITNTLKQTLSSWGYAPIETPTLEVLEVLEQGGVIRKTPFRLFDTDNKLLVLRPDVTLPIARLVATRLDAASLPLRFRYVQPVFREEESLKAAAREYTQIGIESIGMEGPAADAEVILLLVEALQGCGLIDFTISICTVGVLREMLACVLATGDVDEQWCAQMLAAFHASNLVEIEQLLGKVQIDDQYRNALRMLGTISGGREAIDAVRNLASPLACMDGLEDLALTWDIIEGLGQTDHVRVDFSVMSAFDYYTGLVIEAYATGVGTSIGGGGRYDRMLEFYGKSAPAAGFAICLESVMQALLAQGCTDTVSETQLARCVECVLPLLESPASSGSDCVDETKLGVDAILCDEAKLGVDAILCDEAMPRGEASARDTAIANTVAVFSQAAGLRAAGTTVVLKTT
ncbi:MAG: ATP phosphoribosyltransferase regulatory subunit [Coriobacteriia bacterium]|nr:ATP phosphoribosyltransferase regulatory subunit [Coriobacteriia bacterium]